MRIERAQHDVSTAGEPSHPVGLYVTQKKKQVKSDDKVIPLVVLLTLFVTATLVLGVLANYLASKRFAVKGNAKDSSASYDNHLSADSSEEAAKYGNTVDGRKDTKATSHPQSSRTANTAFYNESLARPTDQNNR